MMRNFLYRVATDQERGFFIGVLKALLWVLSLVYACAARFLAWRLRLKPVRLPARVISVGNITLGGTGKTPLVELVCRYLKGEGRRVAVLTRGYACAPGSSAVVPDEAALLRMRLGDIPVIVNPDRAAGAAEAVACHAADTLVLDDGFQQWRLHKDLEIVTIDAGNPFGNGCVIPRGILREPLPALRRADIIVLTKINRVSDTGSLRRRVQSFNPRALIVESRHELTGFYECVDPASVVPLDSLKGCPAAALCGIADPSSFERLLVDCGIVIAETFRFGDHYAYDRADLERIAASAREKKIETIITTEKDLMRLRHLDLSSLGSRVIAARMEMVICNGYQAFLDRLRNL